MSLNAKVFEQIAESVANDCAQKGVDGVFAMTEIDGPGEIYWNLIRRDSVLDPASDGKRYNLLAIALSKLSIAMVHPSATAKDHRWIGETEYRGYIRSLDGKFAYAFSGGTEDQDMEIVNKARRFHAFNA